MIDQIIEKAIDAWIIDRCEKFGVHYPAQCRLRRIPLCVRDGEKGESDRVRMLAAYIAGKGVPLDDIAMLSDHEGFLTAYFRHRVQQELETLRAVADGWEWLGESAEFIEFQHVHMLVFADRIQTARGDYDHAYARLLVAAAEMASAHDYAFLGSISECATDATDYDIWNAERQRDRVLVDVAKRLSDGGRGYIAALEAALDLARSELPPVRGKRGRPR